MDDNLQFAQLAIDQKLNTTPYYSRPPFVSPEESNIAASFKRQSKHGGGGSVALVTFPAK